MKFFMNKQSIIFIIVGIILFSSSFLIDGGTTKAPESLKVSCVAIMKTRMPHNNSLINKCSEKTFAIAITGRNASDVARQIGSTNQLEVIMNMVQKFLWGISGGLLFFGIFLLLKRNKK